MKYIKLTFRFFCIVFISIFVFGFLSVNVGEANAAKFVRIKSSSLGGTWYACGAAWSKLITDNYPEYIAINVASPGLDQETVKRIGRKEAELGILTAIGSYNGFHGVPPAYKEPQPIRACFGIWPGIINAVVLKDSKFKKLQDLKGAKIALNPPGDITGEQMLELLKHHGVTEKNSKFYRVLKADSVRMFIDKRLDCVITYFGHGHALLKEMVSSRGIRFLPPHQAMLKPFLKENPYYTLQEFGDEFGVPNELQLVSRYVNVCRSDLPDDMVYKFTKVWFENLEWLKKVLPANIPYINVKNPRDGVIIPLHPGAEKYFKEVGIMK